MATNLPITTTSTIALHFDFSASAGGLWDVPERILILERVLRALAPIADFPGRAAIRMSTLFGSKRDIERHSATWLNSLKDAEVQAGSTRPEFKTEFDDILVIALSGRLEGLPCKALANLKRAKSYRFLFSVRFTDQAPPNVRTRYLGERTTLLGTFTGDREFGISSEAMFFEKELQQIWARLGIKAAYTTAALCGVYALLQSPSQ